MKKMIYFLFVLLIMSANSMNAQVAIGTENTNLEPRPGTILDLRHVTNNNLGLLLPKVTLTDAKVWAPVLGEKADEVDGMMVFNESTSTKNGLAGKGVYIWVNGSWNIMGDPVEDPCSKPEASFTQGKPTGATICSGLTKKIELAAASGGVGNITYNWIKSTDESNWTNADEPRNAADYTTPATLTGITFYKRQAISETCGTIESDTAKVTVISFSQPNPVNQNVCYGGTTTITLDPATGGSISGTSTITYKWEKHTGDGIWEAADAPNNNRTYDTPALYVDTYYRRLAFCDCGTIESATAIVSVPSSIGYVTSPISPNYKYATYSYPGGRGIWTENVKEAGWARTTYPGHAAGERGYYYSWANARSACSSMNTGSESGWGLPTQAQWDNLIAYLTGSSATADDKNFFWCGSALAGFWSNAGNDWYNWGVAVRWYSNDENGQFYNATANTWTGPMVNTGSSYSVRCFKSN